MKWFGRQWGASICKEENHIPTPVGETCGHCGELIEECDRGVVMPTVCGKGTINEPLHLACFMRPIIGSVGHQQKKCSCFGGTEEDPPNLSKRESAKAALDLFESGFEFPSAWTTLHIPCVICKDKVEIKVLTEDLGRYNRGEGYVQTIFPYLTPDQREMLISKLCKNCWDQTFKEEEEEVDDDESPF